MRASLQAKLYDIFPPERRFPMEPMSRHTTFRIGGPADLLLDAAHAGEVQTCLRLCREAEEPVLLIGNGSNLLVADRGIRGVVLRIGAYLDTWRVEEETLYAGAGLKLGQLARIAAKNGLAGLAFAEGIPGTLGGGVAMNAGAYNGELSQVVQSVRTVDETGDLRVVSAQELAFTYRNSALLAGPLYAVDVTLSLQPLREEVIREEMMDYAARRRAKQPLEWPSAGSAFKRPPEGYASALIDEARLKGLRIGGAEVSEKHAGFIVNRGGATALDVLRLMAEVRESVYAQTGIRLSPEVRPVGDFTTEELALMEAM